AALCGWSAILSYNLFLHDALPIYKAQVLPPDIAGVAVKGAHLHHGAAVVQDLAALAVQALVPDGGAQPALPIPLDRPGQVVDGGRGLVKQRVLHGIDPLSFELSL